MNRRMHAHVEKKIAFNIGVLVAVHNEPKACTVLVFTTASNKEIIQLNANHATS